MPVKRHMLTLPSKLWVAVEDEASWITDSSDDSAVVLMMRFSRSVKTILSTHQRLLCVTKSR